MNPKSVNDLKRVVKTFSLFLDRKNFIMSRVYSPFLENTVIVDQNPLKVVNGYFIVEGLEGCGKSSCIASVASRFRREGIPVKTVKEPGETPIGTWVRELVNRPSPSVSQESLLHLMLAARSGLADSLSLQVGSDMCYREDSRGSISNKNIAPSLVLSDRGFPSTFVLQSGAEYWSAQDVNTIFERIWDMHLHSAFNRAFPQAILWLDVSPAEAKNRLEQRRRANPLIPLSAFDSASFTRFSLWSDIYEKAFAFFVSKGVCVIRIPAEGTQYEVAQRVYDSIQPLFYPTGYPIQFEE